MYVCHISKYYQKLKNFTDYSIITWNDLNQLIKISDLNRDLNQMIFLPKKSFDLNSEFD